MFERRCIFSGHGEVEGAVPASLTPLRYRPDLPSIYRLQVLIGMVVRLNVSSEAVISLHIHYIYV
jgi:hypothetical protein